MATAPTLTTLATFDGTNGAVPNGPLTLDSAGDLYGTTYGTGSGATGLGTVFELAAGATTVTTLATLNATVGDRPLTGVTLIGNGNLIGTTSLGGAQNAGVVYEVAAGSGTATDLATFDDGGPNPNGNTPDGGTLITDPAGNFFGTAYAGGPNNSGGVFEFTASTGALTAVAFLPTAAGNQPVGGVVQDSAGDLFGTTDFGGANNLGAVFEVAAGSTTATVVAAFSTATGGRSASGLAMDAAGNLYGSTFQGGANGDGTVFEIAAGTNTLTVLASFTTDSGYNSEGTLLIDAAGNLFGTASNGGANSDGTVFELAAGSGTITPVVSFSGTSGIGRFQGPLGGVVADSAGNLYGATQYLGASSLGTLFEVSNSGFQVACYCRGTCILTIRGEVAVENLEVGDQVVTFVGSSAGFKPIRWLGHRRIDLRRHPDPANTHPIRFRVGALGEGVPHRDLLVSPNHRMRVGDTLVTAVELANGASIVQESPDQIEYWHIELDGHDVILAEGIQAETYQDVGNRSAFENGSVVELYPVLDGDVSEPCLPYAGASPEVRSHLIARAEALGWTRTTDPAPWIEVGGERIEPAQCGDRYRFELPGPCKTVRLHSQAGRPWDVDPQSGDRRQLGLKLHRLALNSLSGLQEVHLAAPALRHGFHQVERDAEERICRWTTGNTVLDLAELALGQDVTALEIAFDQALPMWVEPPHCCDCMGSAGAGVILVRHQR